LVNENWNFLPIAGCAAQRCLALCAGNQEPAVSQSTRHTPNARTARAVAIARVNTVRAALNTLILSVLLGLLAGAAWTLTT
jgi:hypothetical protein